MGLLLLQYFSYFRRFIYLILFITNFFLIINPYQLNNKRDFLNRLIYT